ncbi:MAG: thioredoxin domain-containing protein [Bacteroidia bacterium]|jgi:hypothetical protein
MEKFNNRLVHASSPYLLQHAHNPVDWQEWSEAAFEEARARDCMVLISIGYSACHWCHVMERECFEDVEVAEMMNKHFVCIKVDREERPDVDQVYMDAVQLVAGNGGWPLNCFTLPDGRPLYGGTYFPKPQWLQVLDNLSQLYASKKEEALHYASNLTKGIQQMNLIGEKENTLTFSWTQMQSIMHQWAESLDFEYGGINRAPKFPMPLNLQLLLDYGVYSGEHKFTEAVHITLNRMADGGIYDQVGGGFARYSTDIFWKVPHFEKMLYDNAQLLSLYAHAYQHQANPRYLEVLEDTFAFLKREMMSEDGLFYSALDADSEGHEGLFYIWSKNELRTILGDDEPVFSMYYAVEESGNWEFSSNILHRVLSDKQMVEACGLPLDEIRQRIRRCNAKLLQKRESRIRPGLDDKIITAWNALTITGCCDAFKATGRVEFLEAAERCADQLLKNLEVHDTWFRIYKNGKASIPAFAEDYACLCEALISLFEVTGKDSYLSKAKVIMSVANELFFQSDPGLFAFNSRLQLQLVTQKFATHDDVIASSNSIFAKCLFKLGFLMDEEIFHTQVKQMKQVILPTMLKIPSVYGNWLQLFLWEHFGWYQLTVTGTVHFPLFRNYYPGLMILPVLENTSVPVLREKKSAAYNQYFLCRDFTCELPVNDPEKALLKIRYQVTNEPT